MGTPPTDFGGLRPAPRGYPIKIVRDLTAEIINASGEPGDLWYGETPADDRMRFLRLKLAEELGEYLIDQGANELADVYAIVLALAVEHGVNLNEMYLADKRGGFSDAVMMYGRHEEFDGA